MGRGPVLLFNFYDWDLGFGVEKLYGALRHGGYEARVISIGLANMTRNVEEWLLLEAFDNETPTAIPAPNPEEIAEGVEAARRLNPSLIGISVMSSHYAHAVRLTRELREKVGAPVVWGGFHPTFEPEESLRDSGADAVCVGEGEDALLEMAERAAAGCRDFSDLANVCTLDSDRRFRRNPVRPLRESLDSIPFYPIQPEDLIRIPSNMLELSRSRVPRADADVYAQHGRMTSYGCPYRCSFCFNEEYHRLYPGQGRMPRRKSVSRVIEECLYGRDVLGKRFISFWDDIFSLNRPWLEEFAERFPKEVDLPFFCYFHPLHASEKAIELIKKAGGTSAISGIQNGSERFRREHFARTETNDQIAAMAERLNPRFYMNYDLIFDTPFETDEDRRETIRLFLRFPHPFSLMTNSFISLPGCSLTHRALAAGEIGTEDLVWKQEAGWDMMDYWQRRRPVRTHNLYILLCLTQHPEFSREEIEAWMNDDEMVSHPYRLRFEAALRLYRKTRTAMHQAADRAQRLQDKLCRIEWSAKKNGGL